MFSDNKKNVKSDELVLGKYLNMIIRNHTSSSARLFKTADNR